MISLVALGFLYQTSRTQDPKYLKRKNQIDELASAFTEIGRSSGKTKAAALGAQKKLADKNYSSFLDPNNTYHILLSYKIKNKRKTVVDNDAYFSYEDQQLREHEKKHHLIYAKEIEKILKNHDFEKLPFFKEEAFLLFEYGLFEPEEVVNVIETNVMRSIENHLRDPDARDDYLKSMLTLYYEKILERDIDKLERRKLLERKMTSPHLINILNSIWK